MDQWISYHTGQLTTASATFARHNGKTGNHADAVIIRPEPSGVTIMMRLGKTTEMAKALNAIDPSSDIITGPDAPHHSDPLARAYELHLRAQRTSLGVSRALQGLSDAGLVASATLQSISDNTTRAVRRSTALLHAIHVCYEGILEMLLKAWKSGAMARRVVVQHMERVVPLEDADARTTVALDAAKLISGWGQAVVATHGPEHGWPLLLGPDTRAVMLRAVTAAEALLDDLEDAED